MRLYVAVEPPFYPERVKGFVVFPEPNPISSVSYPLLYAVANMCASDFGNPALGRGTYTFMFAMAYNVYASYEVSHISYTRCCPIVHFYLQVKFPARA